MCFKKIWLLEKPNCFRTPCTIYHERYRVWSCNVIVISVFGIWHVWWLLEFWRLFFVCFYFAEFPNLLKQPLQGWPCGLEAFFLLWQRIAFEVEYFFLKCKQNSPFTRVRTREALQMGSFLERFHSFTVFATLKCRAISHWSVTT